MIVMTVMIVILSLNNFLILAWMLEALPVLSNLIKKFLNEKACLNISNYTSALEIVINHQYHQHRSHILFSFISTPRQRRRKKN
jgi:hypothetical protein